MNHADAQTETGTPVSLWQTVASVLWAFYGVQSDKNRKRDFSNGSAGLFIAVGLGMTTLFVLLMIGIVKVILASSGAA